MKRIVMSSLLCGLVGIAGAANAAELVATVGDSKGRGTAISFDIATDVQVAAFNFEVAVPGLVAAGAKVDRCGSELPKGFDAKCQVKDGVLMMYAVSSNPSVGIGPGVVGIGTVEISNVSLAKKGGLKVTSMDAYDQAGQSVGLTASAAE